MFDLRFQIRLRQRERICEDDESFFGRAAGERVLQSQIVRRKNVFGEKDAQRPADLNLAFDDGHKWLD